MKSTAYFSKHPKSNEMESKISDIATYRLGKLVSKYLIIIVFSYASELKDALPYMSHISRKFRVLLVENFSAIKRLVIKDAWRQRILKNSKLIQT